MQRRADSLRAEGALTEPERSAVCAHGRARSYKTNDYSVPAVNRPVPSTLSVRVPFAVRKRGGRKLVITPDGETHRPRPHVACALVKALARAHRWQRLLESGECTSITEIAAAEKIDRSYLCRVSG